MQWSLQDEDGVRTAFWGAAVTMWSPQPLRLAVCKPALSNARLFFTLIFLGKEWDGMGDRILLKGYPSWASSGSVLYSLLTT